MVRPLHRRWGMLLSHRAFMVAVVAAGGWACATGSARPGDDRVDGGAPGGDAGPRPDARMPTYVDAAPTTQPPDGDPAACSELSSGYGPLQVIECIPEGMEGKTGTPAPLVVVLHGYTHDPRGMLAATQWDVLAGRYGFYAVFPQSGFDYRAWYWYTTGRSRGQSDPRALVAVVDAMKAKHDIDPDRVFVAGFSAGAYMAVNLLADYPDVFAAGSAQSGGPHGCGVLCPTLPGSAGASAVQAEYPTVWNDPAARKPRLLVMHGGLDGVNAPGNTDDLIQQWAAAVGIDAVPDNADLGVATELKGYPYTVYAKDGEVAIAHIALTDLGHGVAVDPGDGADQGGWDEHPSKTADSCATCPQDWTNTGTLYGAYYEAQFFGLTQ